MTFANKFIFFLLCALIVFTTIAYGTVHQPVIALFYLVIAIIPILWAVDGFQSGGNKFSKSLIQIPLYAAAIYGLIQVFPLGTQSDTADVANIARTISLDSFSTQTAALNFLALAIFLSAILSVTDSAKRLQKIVYVVTVFGFAYAFFAILQSVLSPAKIYGIYEVRNGSPFGSFVNRNNFAAYMEMALCLPLGLIFVGGIKKDKRLLYVTAIVLMGIALVLSGSRGGLVALLAQIIFLIILTTKSNNYGQIALKAGLSVMLIAAIIFGSIFVGGETSLTRIAETGLSENSTTDRTHIWDVTVRVIKDNLPLGAGLGAFGVAYTKHDSFSGLERVEQAHNDYLQVLADAGIIGLMLGIFFIFRLFRAGFKNLKTENTFRRGIVVGALAGCFSIFVHSVFDFVLHTTAISVLFLTLVSLVISAGNDFEDDVEEIYPRRKKSRQPATVTPIAEGRKRKELQ